MPVCRQVDKCHMIRENLNSVLSANSNYKEQFMSTFQSMNPEFHHPHLFKVILPLFLNYLYPQLELHSYS